MAVLPVRAMVRPRRPHLPLRRSRYAVLDIPARFSLRASSPSPEGTRVKAVRTLILAGRHEVGKASPPQTARTELAAAVLALAAARHPGRPRMNLLLPHPRDRPTVTSSALNAIASLHADARTAEETDWVQIVEWYDAQVRQK